MDKILTARNGQGLGTPLMMMGNALLDTIAGVGHFALFTLSLMRELVPGLRYGGLILDQARFIGVGSLPLVILTSVFVGGVAALQAAYQFQGSVPLLYVGTVITKSVFIELGPVLTALVVGSRVGSSFAAEIGTMRVTEQIDALETLAIRPVRFLAVPRLVAAFFMLPVVTVLADLIAVLGGMFVAVNRVGLHPATFTRGMRLLFEDSDIYGGLIKSFVFGIIIAVMGCFYGFQTTGGAEGVGIATTRAVVASCVLILVADYFLAEVIFRLLFPGKRGMIEVRGLTKSFPGHMVLDGVDLDVPNGQSLVILGRSGSGKSVLLKLIIGLLRPDSGAVRVDGQEVASLRGNDLAALRRRFGMLFQMAALFDSMTVFENVGLPLREHTHLSREEIAKVVAEKLALVGLEGIERKKPAALSGGMRKRVGLARALAMDPETMLYDEPTTGLDPVTAQQINDLIKGLQNRLHITSIVVTHDMASAFQVGDRLCLLHEGKIRFDGTPAEMRASRDRVVREFLAPAEAALANGYGNGGGEA